MVNDPLVEAFPGLSGGYKQTSEATPTYNCIAWTVGATTRWWWPNDFGFWPAEAPREKTMAAFIRAYETLGFGVCVDSSLEQGFQKIAIYTDRTGKPTHAARQLRNGHWTSKLGQDVDIEHERDALNGGYSGDATVFMKRPVWWKKAQLAMKRLITAARGSESV